MGEGAPKIQTSSSKIKRPGDIMYSIVTVVNNTVLYFFKIAKRVDLKSSYHTHKKNLGDIMMLTKLTVVVISRRIQISNHYAGHHIRC